MFEPKINETKLKIIYLFMRSDGELTSSEKENFIELYKAFIEEYKHSLSYLLYRKSPKDRLEEFCNSISINSDSDNSGIINKIIKKLLNEQDKFSIKDQVHTIWTLINIGYSDGEYTDAEKSVVNHLCMYWNINRLIKKELMDSVDAILVLSKQKEWLLTTDKSDETIKQETEVIDKKIQQIFNDVEIIISEADIKLSK